MNLDEAWNILQKNEFKRTKNRDVILQFFAAHNRYLTAGDVKLHMEKDNPGISFDTIYRNLATFTELGILEETELTGERHFRMHCEPGVHHHHFICTLCGVTRNIPECPMDILSIDLSNYEIESHKFEVYGKCPQCIAS
ncbi:Fur family transcriptional regulator [Sporosarcina pasteurii]|uniref:Zinc-specific metallo-regulatory protein n=1 Tax=Sporosarcina pasteurii TaxID=1474 RepID=A0A380BNC7_SPOPA|nr:Fur family transcriptional regulator [Sporosarcina pasteurii]MDS9471053.1 Fur family transcriptional regulator [Sporosarcina pasteurii]QBQ05303.1 transcriptional repressor [Sporosarcina pasteurii]SUJ04163.1 Zinc-specific metallo-regulatory protein [Sporosarcina pasteurii]